MFSKFLSYCLLVLVFFSCGKTTESKISTGDTEKQIVDKSFALNDSLYRSENNRLTKYLLTFGGSKGRINPNAQSRKEKQVLVEKYSLAMQAADSIKIGQIHFELGEYYQYNMVSDSSYYHYNKSIQHLKDPSRLQNAYLYLSILLSDNEIFSEGLVQVENAISLNTRKTDVYKMYCQTYVMADIKLGLEQYKEAIELFHQASTLLSKKEIISYFNEYQISLNRISIKNSLAKAYIENKDYEEADLMLKLALKELEQVREVDKDLFYPLLIHKYASIKLALNEYDAALVFILESLKRNTSLHNEYSINRNKLLYAEYFFKRKNKDQGIVLLNQVLESTIQHNDLELHKQTLEMLLIYDNTNTRENFQAYQNIDRRINQESNLTRSSFARLKYESDFLIRSNQLLKDKNTLIAFVSIMLILLFLVLLIIVFFRNKAKEISLVQMYQKDTEKYYDSIIHIQNRIKSAQEFERKKFAKELHDGILNKLFVTRFSLLQLERTNLEATKETLVNEVKEVESFIRNSSQALYNDEKFLVSDFKQLIEELVAMQNRSVCTTFTCVIDSELNLESLSHRVKINIYRILQEAFQNVQKYAEAKTCNLEFSYVSETVFRVKVVDTGKGFIVKTVKRGLGLKNMEDRLYALNSKLVLSSKKGIGTSISFEIVYNLSLL